MKTLLLMRHGKSDWDAVYDTDHNRPLNRRGVRSARAMGRVLSDQDLAPDLVVTSSAVRAKTTAQLAVEAGRWDCDIRIEARLYGSGPDTAVEIAARTPEHVDRLLLVGHQPTWSTLVSALTGEKVEMKTATVAVIEFEFPGWSAMETGSGRLSGIYQPRDYL